MATTRAKVNALNCEEKLPFGGLGRGSTLG
jgi:hypothetical protein